MQSLTRLEMQLLYILFISTMEANGINYYKGVLLCSRPNESPSITKKKEFCGRVFPRDQLGLVPVKTYDEHKTRKRVLPVLNNHKKWLEKFKKDVHDHKQQQEKEKEKAAERLQKIKQEGYQLREKQKNTSTVSNQVEAAESPAKRPEPNLKKKQKPAWAKTAQEAEQTEEKEVDELLDFFESKEEGQLKDYVSDGDVKNILTDLKSKIQKLKQQQDWRKEQLKRIEDDKHQRESVQSEPQKDDILSRISKQSGAQSISSQKTVERVQQLQRRKQQLQWDKQTGTQKKTMASVDQQIAKHVADEVLRNYPHLKHHSNQSIRQLLEKQAHQQLKS